MADSWREKESRADRKQDIAPSFGTAKPYDTPLGLLLLVVYLFFDGFTSTSQEKLFKGYAMSSNHQMFIVGCFSALISVFRGSPARLRVGTRSPPLSQF